MQTIYPVTHPYKRILWLLDKIIGDHTVKQGKVFKKIMTRLNGNSMPCSSKRPSLCCTQVLNTQTFTS